MCQNNPRMELLTIWGFTEEEIERRWEVHYKFDPVNRFCGSSSDSDKKSPPPQPVDNSDHMLSLLDRLLPQGESNE